MIYTEYKDQYSITHDQIRPTFHCGELSVAEEHDFCFGRSRGLVWRLRDAADNWLLDLDTLDDAVRTVASE
jgi:hypothetical protein